MGNSHPIEQHLSRDWLPQWRAGRLLLAVSGGADSVALLRAVHTVMQGQGGELFVAHVNHRLRGAESDADEAFVAELCRRLGVPLEVCRVDVERAAQQQGDGIEAAARGERYRFFRSLAHRLGADWVLTAHTADDQAETILHRIVRGTGLAGLAGIPRCRPLTPNVQLVRPLLEVTRGALVDYLHALGQPYREDSSNLDLRFTRNRLRHELLTHLAEHYNSGIADALVRLGRLAGEAQAVIDRVVSALKDGAVRPDGEAIAVERAILRDEPRYAVREVLIAAWRERGWPLQGMGFAQWDQLADLLLADEPMPTVTKRMFPGSITAERRGETLRLSREA